jgi:hypothetical protein
VVIGHGCQQEKLSHTQDDNKKQLSGTYTVGNSIVPRCHCVEESRNADSCK